MNSAFMDFIVEWVPIPNQMFNLVQYIIICCIDRMDHWPEIYASLELIFTLSPKIDD